MHPKLQKRVSWLQSQKNLYLFVDYIFAGEMLWRTFFLIGNNLNPVAAKIAEGNFGQANEGEGEWKFVNSFAIFFFVDFEKVVHVLLSFEFTEVNLFAFLFCEPMVLSIIILKLFLRNDSGRISYSFYVLYILFANEIRFAQAFALFYFVGTVLAIINQKSMMTAMFRVGCLTSEVHFFPFFYLD